MQFLYGDSSPSTLTTDWIDLLGKALDCFVAIFEAEQRMALGAARGRELEARAEQEVARLRALETAVARAIAGVIEGGSPDAPVTRCSDVISRSSSGAVNAADAELRAALGAELQRVEESAARERARACKAVEQLLLQHDLPGSELELRIEPRPGAGYNATLLGTTAYGVATVVEVDIPTGSLLARPLRVSDVSEALEIQVPKTAGWIRKESRLATEKLGRLVIQACSFSPRSQRVAARLEGGDEGYDFHRAAGAPPRAARIGGDPSPSEFELGEADARAVAAFLDKLAGAAHALIPNRKALARLEIDGIALDSHRQPSTLVGRLVEVMAPMVREIAARSGSPHELVLRRQLGDGRREERFVHRADLLAKLSSLPNVQRGVLAPFALGEIPEPPADERSQEISAGSIVEIPAPPPAPPVRVA
jgi:hypothetical protein